MTLNGSGKICPHCLGNKLHHFSAKAHDSQNENTRVNIVECRRCDFAWQWPILRTPGDSVEYFKSQYECKETSTYFDRDIRRNIAMLQTGFLNSHFESPGSLLDVGAGDGTFIKAAALHGWQAVGIEPAAKEASHTFREDAKLIRATLSELSSFSEFDVVTMWDVIEHVESPDDIMDNVLPMVKLGGYLVIETGNYQSVDRINGADSWWNYQLDHKWYYSPPIIETMLRRRGFGNFIHADRVFRPWWEGTANYTGPLLMPHLKSAIKRPILAASVLRRYLALRQYANRCPAWSGLPIFTIAAQRIP